MTSTPISLHGYAIELRPTLISTGGYGHKLKRGTEYRITPEGDEFDTLCYGTESSKARALAEAKRLILEHLPHADTRIVVPAGAYGEIVVSHAVNGWRSEIVRADGKRGGSTLYNESASLTEVMESVQRHAGQLAEIPEIVAFHMSDA